MENPASWKSAELVIGDAYEQWHISHERCVIGLSLPAYIAQALRASGHIDDSKESPIGWEGLREHHAEKETD